MAKLCIISAKSSYWQSGPNACAIYDCMLWDTNQSTKNSSWMRKRTRCTASSPSVGSPTNKENITPRRHITWLLVDHVVDQQTNFYKVAFLLLAFFSKSVSKRTKSQASHCTAPQYLSASSCWSKNLEQLLSDKHIWWDVHQKVNQNLKLRRPSHLAAGNGRSGRSWLGGQSRLGNCWVRVICQLLLDDTDDFFIFFLGFLAAALRSTLCVFARGAETLDFLASALLAAGWTATYCNEATGGTAYLGSRGSLLEVLWDALDPESNDLAKVFGFLAGIFQSWSSSSSLIPSWSKDRLACFFMFLAACLPLSSPPVAYIDEVLLVACNNQSPSPLFFNSGFDFFFSSSFASLHPYIRVGNYMIFFATWES